MKPKKNAIPDFGFEDYDEPISIDADYKGYNAYIERLFQKQREKEEEKEREKKSQKERQNRIKNTFSGFDCEIYEHLPDLLRSITNNFATGQEKDTALFCSLILCSGILPDYYTIYNNRKYEANLFGYLYGGFGTGKGVLNICKTLLNPLHEMKLRQGESIRFQHQKQLGLEKSSNTSSTTLQQDKVLFIPGNITKSAFYKMLIDNDKRGILIETETDTISAANKGEHGNFSDIFRAAFEHEDLSISRKTEGSIFITHPCLTLMISSTPKQIRRFISEVENGLYSRFCFFKVEADPKFKKVFETTSYNINEDNWISDLLQWLQDELKYRKGVQFSFTPTQQERFYNYFNNLKEEYREIYGEEMDGVVHRLGLICTRIAMILTIFRAFDLKNNTYDISSKYTCNDIDFHTSLLVTVSFSENTKEVYEILTPDETKNELYQLQEKKLLEEECVNWRKRGLSHAEIAKRVFGKATAKSSVHRILKKHGF